MRFLLPVGGVVDNRFGILTGPGHIGIPIGIKEGMVWAADNEVFTRGFRPEVYFPWLETMRPYRDTCLFVTVPDVLGDAVATLDRFPEWQERFSDWPIAFVAQDGQENLPFPKGFTTLFIGGSTRWKIGPGALACIKWAQTQGIHVHIGRVNWRKRYNYFDQIQGSEEFTCDGTRPRFEGIARTLAAWAGYQSHSEVLKLW